MSGRARITAATTRITALTIGPIIIVRTIGRIAITEVRCMEAAAVSDGRRDVRRDGGPAVRTSVAACATTAATDRYRIPSDA